MFKTFCLTILYLLYLTVSIQIACICIGTDDMIFSMSHAMLVEVPKFDLFLFFLPDCHHATRKRGTSLGCNVLSQ